MDDGSCCDPATEDCEDDGEGECDVICPEDSLLPGSTVCEMSECYDYCEDPDDANFGTGPCVGVGDPESCEDQGLTTCHDYCIEDGEICPECEEGELCQDESACNLGECGECTFAEEGFDCDGEPTVWQGEFCADYGECYYEGNTTCTPCEEGDCPHGWVTCGDGSCAASEEECPIAAICEDADACNTGEEGDCVYAEDGADCDGNPLSCAEQGKHACDDGTCVDFEEDCPNTDGCQPFYYMCDNECIPDDQECDPFGTPLTCDDESACNWNLAGDCVYPDDNGDCPGDEECELTEDDCEEGQYLDSEACECKDYEETEEPCQDPCLVFNPVTGDCDPNVDDPECDPEQLCDPAVEDCPEDECDEGEELCDNGMCYPSDNLPEDCRDIDLDNCPEGQIEIDGNCIDTSDATCEELGDVTCPDGSCAYDEQMCTDVASACTEDEVTCLDGTCADSQEDCEGTEGAECDPGYNEENGECIPNWDDETVWSCGNPPPNWDQDYNWNYHHDCGCDDSISNPVSCGADNCYGDNCADNQSSHGDGCDPAIENCDDSGNCFSCQDPAADNYDQQ